MEPQAPRRKDLCSRILAPAALAALLALPVASPAAAGAGPEPDAAPQAPAVAPDPAPGAATDGPTEAPTQPPSTPPADSQPAAPAPAQQPSAPGSQPGESKPKAADDRKRTSAPRHRGDGEEAAVQASSMLRIKSLLPDGPTADDSSPRLVLLAAGALLALVLASGSMLSVTSRAMKGQLR